MKNFLKGVLFAIVGIPLLEGLAALIEQGTKHVCTAIAAKTYDIEKGIDCDGDEPEETTYAIGFQAPDSSDEEEDEEEDE